MMKGVPEGIRNLENIRRRLLKGMEAGLYHEAERIMADSKTNYVPVDLGTLKGSGRVEQPTNDGQTIRVTLGYGGAASAYALVQHERLDYHHTVGQAKYLETPVMNAAHGLGQRLGMSVRITR